MLQRVGGDWTCKVGKIPILADSDDSVNERFLCPFTIRQRDMQTYILGRGMAKRWTGRIIKVKTLFIMFYSATVFTSLSDATLTLRSRLDRR